MSVGELSSADGVVELRYADAAEWSAAKTGERLAVGDRVRTGPDARAVVDLADGSRLSVGNDSEVEITEFLLKTDERSAIYTLSRGKLRTFVREFSGKTDVRVKTPTSVSGVKGTDFLILNRGSANVFFGKTGVVAVESVDGGAGDGPVSLTSGVMTENTLGTEPIPPVEVEPGSELERVRAQLEAITDVGAPVEWEAAGRLPMILARWNINYAAYLADRGDFSSALDVLRIAIDLTDSPSQKAEAHIGRGSVLGRNIGDAEGSLAEYAIVLDEYPIEPFLEDAVFSSAMVSTEIGDVAKARALFTRYLDRYPEGGHRETAETFLRALDGPPPPDGE